MPALSLALVILAGLIHAVWNITAKKAGGDVRFAAFTGVLMALIWAPLGICADLRLTERARTTQQLVCGFAVDFAAETVAPIRTRVPAAKTLSELARTVEE